MVHLMNEYHLKKDFHNIIPNDGDVFTFNIPVESDSTIEITIEDRLLKVFHSFEPSVDLYNSFLKNLSRDSYSEAVEAEMQSYLSTMYDAAKKLMLVLKYSLNAFWLDESILDLEKFYWSSDRIKWTEISVHRFLIHGLSSQPLVLTNERANIIQEYLANNQEPFIALRHLHRAKNELSPRFRWIEATTAAELAIKEFLMRYVPKVQFLLFELPTPPLKKLYGVILETYAGHSSPKLTQLAEGIEIRNELVHRPSEISISFEESEIYVHDVEVAIFDLLKTLYPKDSLIHDIINS